LFLESRAIGRRSPLRPMVQQRVNDAPRYPLLMTRGKGWGNNETFYESPLLRYIDC
jgi:hypothetical protein